MFNESLLSFWKHGDENEIIENVSDTLKYVVANVAIKPNDITKIDIRQSLWRN